jgi:hypothetical protein
MSFALLSVLSVFSPQAPILPAQCTDELYQLNYEIQRSLHERNFTQARQLLHRWTYGEVKYFLESPLLETSQGADRDAAQMWEEVTENRIRFLPAQNGEEPGILVRLKPVSGAVVEVRPPYWDKRCVVAEIPVLWGPLQQPLSRVAVARAIARAFGFAVGLAPTKTLRGVMVSHLIAGPQPLTLPGMEANITLFTEEERERIHQILSAREALEKLILEERPLTPAVPRLEVSPKLADAGFVRTGQVPRFELLLKNSGNATLAIVPEVSCGCILLDKIEKVAPGEEIRITAALDTRDLVGKIAKEIIFHTNDPIEPHHTVMLSATATPEYRVVPDSNSYVLKDEGETTIELYFCVMTESPIKLLHASIGDPRVSVKFEPWAGELVDPPFGEKPVPRMGYRLTLTFPESIEAGAHWFDLYLKTDSHFMPNKIVNIQAQKGLYFVPRGFYFGGVDLQPGAVRAVTLLHPSRAFKILSVEVEGKGFEVNYEPLGQAPGITEFKQYLLKATYQGGLKGMIQAVVVVTTDHPRYPVIKIPITGTIPDGGTLSASGSQGNGSD